jgi:hypothetical protein
MEVLIIKRILFILCLICLLIVPINAETLSGTFGSSGLINSTTYDAPTVSGGTNQIRGLQFKDVEKIQGLTALIAFEKSVFTYDANAPSGATANFNLYLAKSASDFSPSLTDTTLKGTGTIGYQRYFNGASPPVEQTGYIWMVISGFNNTGLSGTQYFSMSYNHNDLYNMSAVSTCQPANIPSGYGVFIHGASNNQSAGGLSSLYTMNKEASFIHNWYAIKPSGIGITGGITKNGFNSRVFISNISNIPITSDNLFNSVNFNFSVPDQVIYISALDVFGNWYNSSQLFAPALPTPTPTGTVTPAPTGGLENYSNVTLTIKNNLNNTVISGATVQIIRHDVNNHVDTAISNSNGIANFANINIQQYLTQEVKVVKSGYQITNEWITISPFSYAKTVYLTPDVGGNPTVPANINITVTVRNANGGALISNAYVSAFDSQAQLSGSNLLTNSTGVVVFNNFANTAFIEGRVSKTGFYDKYWQKEPIGVIGQTDYSTTVYIEAISGGGGVTPTPTPVITPVGYDYITLSANPTAIALGSTSVLTTTCSNVTACAKPTLSLALYYENSNSPNGGGNKLVGVYKYNATANNYDFRVNNGAVWQTGFANPLTLTVHPAIASQYTYSVALSNVTGSMVTQTRSLGTATTSLLVGGGGDFGILTMSLSAQDGSTGSHLSNYNLNITNSITGALTDIGLVSYEHEMSLARGSIQVLQCSKTGYIDGSTTFTVPTDTNIVAGSYGAMATCRLFPNGSTEVGKTAVTVHVSDAETYYPLGNVLITISGTGFTIPSPRYTGASGEGVLFLIPYNMEYTATATKDGYCAVSDGAYTGTNSYQYMPLVMKYGACTGTTPTPTPTGSVTVTPTPTPIHYGNHTEEDARVCGAMPVNATFVDVLLNGIACNGFEDKESQNMALAVLIILFCALILGKVAKGVGVLAGVIAGAVIAMALGFLPFWIIIVLVILAGLIFASKIFWSND